MGAVTTSSPPHSADVRYASSRLWRSRGFSLVEHDMFLVKVEGKSIPMGQFCLIF